jgi:hypothetical protein
MWRRDYYRIRRRWCGLFVSGRRLSENNVFTVVCMEYVEIMNEMRRQMKVDSRKIAY